jgi:CopG family transcriptional regulator, nickel-responsive regulator
MTKLARFGVSLEETLLKKYDALLRNRGYTSRSEAFRDLIRAELIQQEWQVGNEVAGAITIVYDHHRKDLVHKITDIQHDYQLVVISTQHIHLDHDHCLEIIAVKGTPADVRRLADTLRSIRGIKHGTLSMSSTGKNLD